LNCQRLTQPQRSPRELRALAARCSVIFGTFQGASNTHPKHDVIANLIIEKSALQGRGGDLWSFAFSSLADQLWLEHNIGPVIGGVERVARK
jgi:hypothetical protein